MPILEIGNETKTSVEILIFVCGSIHTLYGALKA
jgi:hypothetical protein